MCCKFKVQVFISHKCIKDSDENTMEPDQLVNETVTAIWDVSDYSNGRPRNVFPTTGD